MKNLFLYFIFLLLCNTILSQTIVYEELITDGFDYTIDDGVEDDQHNTTFVGMKGNFSLHNTVYYNIYIMKLNTLGQVIGYKEIANLSPLNQTSSAARTIGSPSIIFLPNNEYLVAGTILEPDNVHTQLAFWYLDMNFNILQTYEQGQLGEYELFMDIIKDKQGDFVISYLQKCGTVASDLKTMIAKYDASFQLKASNEIATCVSYLTFNTFSKQGILEKTNNKGYYVFRHGKDPSNVGSQPFIEMKGFNSSLQLQSIDTISITVAFAAIPNVCASWIDKQKQVIVGSTPPYSWSNKQDIHYYIRDTLGNVMYQDTIQIDNSNEISATGAIANRLNHDFYIGFTKGFDGIFMGSGLSKYMLLKIDEFGNKKWRAEYGDSAGQYVMYKTLATYDGGIIMAGTKMMDNRPALDTVRHGIYIVKVMDNTINIDAPILSENSYRIFPNPADNKLIISLLENISAKVELLDLQGKVCFRKDFVKECEMEVQDFSAGLYFYRIVAEGHKTAFGKWVKQ